MHIYQCITLYIIKKVSRAGNSDEKVGKNRKIFPIGAFCKKRLMTHKRVLKWVNDPYMLRYNSSGSKPSSSDITLVRRRNSAS